MQKSDIVQHPNAVRGADQFDNFVSKRFVAGAKNIGAAQDGGLQNRVVVRVAYNGRRNFRQLHQYARRFQKDKLLFYGFFRQGPSGLNVRISQHPLNFDQNGRREDKHVRSRYDGQKKVPGKPQRRNPGVGSNKDICIENHPHGCQLR